MSTEAKSPNSGARFMAALLNQTEARIEWTWRRIRTLLDEGKGKRRAVAIAREEAKAMTW